MTFHNWDKNMVQGKRRRTRDRKKKRMKTRREGE